METKLSYIAEDLTKQLSAIKTEGATDDKNYNKLLDIVDKAREEVRTMSDEVQKEVMKG